MNINNIVSYNQLGINKINKKAQSFTSSTRGYEPDNTQKQYFYEDWVKNNTWFFRRDLNWENLPEILDSNFKDKSKINTYCLGCSDGSEAYSLAIAMKEQSKNSEKYLPINASDIDPIIIKAAQKRKINIEDGKDSQFKKADMTLINEFVTSGKQYFIKSDNGMDIKDDGYCGSDDYHCYEPVDELKQAVDFKVEDILTSLKNIKDNGNSIVMCRNLGPYLKSDYEEEMVDTMKKVLKPGSIVITGDYDKYSNYIDLLEAETNGKADFVKLDRNVYKRV